MNGLIEQISNDPDMDALSLTAECETVQEMSAFRDALQNRNTVITKVFFRESFFPLRRLRMHLSRENFITFLHIVSDIQGLHELELPRCMPGMLTCGYVVHVLEHTTTLRTFHAHGTITFVSRRAHDVQQLADKFTQNVDHLKVIDMDDSHIMVKRRRARNSDSATSSPTQDTDTSSCLMDPIFNCSLPRLTHFYLSSDTAVSSSSSTTSSVSRRDDPDRRQYAPGCLVSSIALHTFLLGDNVLHRSCLLQLSLNHLGLDDSHVFVIAEFLRVESCVLEILKIHDNHSITHIGNRTLVESLKCNSSLCLVCTTRPATTTAKDPIMVETTTTPIMKSSTGHSDCIRDTISWREVFANNFTLEILSYESWYHCQSFGDDEDEEGDDEIRDDNELQFWLALNRTGRRQWWRDHAKDLSKDDWIYVLEDVTLLPSHNWKTPAKVVPSILYYLLRSYPMKIV